MKKKWLFVIVIGVLLTLILAVSGIFLQWEQVTRSSERHDMTCSIVLEVNRTIENVTLYLPVPELQGTPVLAGSFVDRSAYGVPSDWNITIIPVEGRQVLSIRAPRIVPDYAGYPLPVEPGKAPDRTPVPSSTVVSPVTPVLIPIEMTILQPWPSAINTTNPAGHEPVFRPDGEYSPVRRNVPGYSGNAFAYHVPVYLNYTAESPADVSVRTSIEGVNAIWKGGWVFNRYSDTVILELRNGTRGWFNTGGTLVTGEGVFW